MKASRLALIQDRRYLDHVTGDYHPERPERLLAIQKMLKGSGLDQKALSLEPREATLDEISQIHTEEMIGLLSATQFEDFAELDPDTVASKNSWMAAKLAAGGCLTAIDCLMDGKAEEAFVFPRPPGHHAERDRPMGFCLLNNVAIAAEYALQKKGLKRILILDFDVHHGNGTQHIFESRSDIFYLSTHRAPFYPGTGAASEIGKGVGEGYTLNLPLPALSGDSAYVNLFKERIVPATLVYQPDLMLISAGFDAHVLDPLGGMQVTEQGFEAMVRSIESMRIALGNIPVLYVLEGGYSLEALSKSVEKIVRFLIHPGEK